ncbi:unnamed protein product [Rhizophagus irregularis]|nr:unnamed protein product [Rhizophagus irregularis]
MQVYLDNECSRAPDNAKSAKQNVGSQDSILKTIQSLLNIVLNFISTDTLTNRPVKRIKTQKKKILLIYFRPFFKLPNRKRLADELLDDVYDEVKMHTDEQISKAKSLCMVSDGWSNINQVSVQNFIVCTPKLIFFDAIFLAAAKLKRIQIKNYNKEIALVLLTLTQWGMHLNCFQSLLKSKIALEQVLMDSEIYQKINREVRNNVLSEEFWKMANLITKFLEPMVVALKLLESDSSTLSTVYSNFKKLMNKVSEISCNFSDNIQQLIQKRWEYSYHPVIMVTYILDSHFLEESKDADIEAIRYTEFTEFANKRFGQEESIKLFAELVTFR